MLSLQVNGEPRKKHYAGKWELVVQKATRSLQEMLRAASQRRRNVIIDQVSPNFLPKICSFLCNPVACIS
jgi:heterogeneous nuclear ribonucleoprotein U-like protein 1